MKNFVNAIKKADEFVDKILDYVNDYRSPEQITQSIKNIESILENLKDSELLQRYKNAYPHKNYFTFIDKTKRYDGKVESNISESSWRNDITGNFYFDDANLKFEDINQNTKGDRFFNKHSYDWNKNFDEKTNDHDNSMGTGNQGKEYISQYEKQIKNIEKDIKRKLKKKNMLDGIKQLFL